ncbi:hypothetical protein ACGFNV_13145 [Streptomyces sp. NPDC048751]|uniref:YqeB family protein n=1 Tax=Streptomyces sp. NPDC048751 TaxID=3365591 RepID=UPI0037212AB0
MESKRPDHTFRTPSATGGSTATVLGYPRSDKILILVGMPLAGAVVGLLLPVLARQITGLSKLPLRTVAEFVASVEETWQVVAFMAGGLVVGVGFAFVSLSESLTVTLTDARLEAVHDHWGRESHARADVSAVFLDGRTLVVLDHDSRQLVRGTHAAPARQLAAAFRAHGYPWQAGDPYADLFQKWSPGSGALRPEVDAVLTARKEALKHKSGYDVRELTRAVEELGHTVRDSGTEQFWRPLVQS